MDTEIRMPTYERFAAQLELLRTSVSFGLIITQICGMGIAFLVVRSHVSMLAIFLWGAIAVAILVARRAWLQSLDFKAMSDHELMRAFYKIVAGTMLTGLMWSVPYILIAGDVPPATQYMCLMIIFLITAISMGTASIIREHYVADVTAALYPICWWYFMNYWTFEHNIILAIMLTLGGAALIVRSGQVYHNYRRMIESNWRNETLFDELSGISETLRTRNQELEDSRKIQTVLANSDELTGLYNRRFFNRTLSSEWRRARRSGAPVSCIMLDVDFFKLYNDNYGHPAGDDCLQRIAKCMQDAVSRAGDILARYGGEEFVVLMPGITSDEAHTVSIRIAERIRLEEIPHEHSEVSEFVTVSQGIASCRPNDDTDGSFLINLADEALYDAKEKGRNTSVSKSGNPALQVVESWQ